MGLHTWFPLKTYRWLGARLQYHQCVRMALLLLAPGLRYVHRACKLYRISNVDSSFWQANKHIVWPYHMAWASNIQYILTQCNLMVSYGDIDLVTADPGNGLLPDGTKPLPAPTLTYNRLGPITFFLGQFQTRSSAIIHLNLNWKIFIQNFI